MSFRHALAWVTYSEVGPGADGVIADHPDDRGKRTVWGVSTPTYYAWLKRAGREPRPIDLLSATDLHAIYWDIWSAARCSALLPRLGVAVFDAAVNSGVERAVKTLQRTLGPAGAEPLLQDGQFGPKTMAALDRAVALHGKQQVLDGFLEWRDVFYDRLVALDPTQQVFLSGWKRRLAELRGFLEWVEP